MNSSKEPDTNSNSSVNIVIDRSKWRTGDRGPNQTGHGFTQLLNDQGCMCCLGFICSKMTEEEILEAVDPADLSTDIPELNILTKVYNKNTELTNKAININDDINTTPQEKEELLKKLFADSRYNLEFTGEYN